MEFAGLPSFLSSIGLGSYWLEGMADAAKLLNMPIQYCMSNTRHALKAVELDIVTQVIYRLLQQGPQYVCKVTQVIYRLLQQGPQYVCKDLKRQKKSGASTDGTSMHRDNFLSHRMQLNPI